MPAAEAPPWAGIVPDNSLHFPHPCGAWRSAARAWSGSGRTLTADRSFQLGFFATQNRQTSILCLTDSAGQAAQQLSTEFFAA